MVWRTPRLAPALGQMTGLCVSRQRPRPSRRRRTSHRWSRCSPQDLRVLLIIRPQRPGRWRRVPTGQLPRRSDAHGEPPSRQDRVARPGNCSS